MTRLAPTKAHQIRINVYAETYHRWRNDPRLRRGAAKERSHRAIQHLFQPLGIEHSCSAIVDEGKEPNSMTFGATCGIAGWERALGRSMIMRLHLMEDLVSEICSVDDEDELHAALMTAARRMCFDHFALVYDRRAGDEAEANLLIHDYPDAWANVYVDFDLGGADPVRRAGERSLVGFEWQHLPDLVPMTEGDRHMLAVGRENGVGDGFTVPRHLPGEASGSCSFAVRPNREIPREMLHVAEIVGAFALASARRIVGVAPVRERPVLSKRQRECVLWSARGKSQAEIAAILGISEETVNQHLRTARDRYAVHCRQALILCALFDGLIGFGDIIRWARPAVH